MTIPILLTINSGSSSVKFQVFTQTKELDLLAKGKIYDLGTTPTFKASNQSTNQNVANSLDADCTHEEAILLILDWVKTQPDWEVKAVAHRVVHGGELFTQSVLITPAILDELSTLNSLAPLHQPHNLAAIHIIEKTQPSLPQIACFDTAFHANHTPVFTTYALPLKIRELGIRRYGFHGLSFEWIAHALRIEHPKLAKGKVVVAHLGNGASLCALLDGVSIDTTMGLTALDGLPMGTRCGSIDPGAIIYLVRELGISPSTLEGILYNDSGLLGLSGLTNDVKELQESEDESAQFALDYFCLKAAQFIGMMAISLDGIDALVFTGGIGENSQLIRDKILARIHCLRPFSHLVMPANEEKMMAMHAFALLEN
ncbi:MAG TPA: acetate/propionate family kinase [Legionella sp.]|nr:acetate/propionate family kinase [Legionella sp.]